MKNILKGVIISCVAAVVGLAVLLLLLLAPTAVLVLDPAWQALVPKTSITQFRTASLKARCIPKIIKCSSSDINNPQNLQMTIQAHKRAKVILLSPVDAAALSTIPEEEQKLKDENSKTIIVAITSENAPFADVVLEPDYESGWDAVPQEDKDKCIANKDISKAGLDTEGSFIVDYRYGLAVPSKQIYGMIVPDFARALDEVLSSSTTGKFYHEYHKN